MIKIDSSELKEYLEKLEKLTQDEIGEFFEEETKRGGLMTQRNVVKTTPVDTGNMRKSWYIDSRVQRKGSIYRIKVFNTARGEANSNYPSGAPYPYYVEHGHRIVVNGRKVGYVDGIFILDKAKKKAEKKIKQNGSQNLKRFIERKLK